MTRLINTIIVIGLVAILVEPVFAATDGSAGATSTGTSDISVTTVENIKITDVADMTTVNPYVAGTGYDSDDDVCIWTNDPDGQYVVQADGDGAGSAFTITDGTDTIAYTVKWSDTTTTGGNQLALTATVENATVQNNASGTYPCPANNANFRVEMTDANILSAQAGTYTGTLTLIVSPDSTN